MTSPSIEDIIAAIPEWRGRSAQVEPVHGGLTNRAFCVRVDGTPHFVSIPGAFRTPGHPARSRSPTPSPLRKPGSPARCCQIPEAGVLVAGSCGRTLSKADMHAPACRRIGPGRAALHTAHPFANDFDLFRLTQAYAEVLTADGFALPSGFEAVRPPLAEMETATNAHRLPPAPCSNDLVPENLIDDDGRLWIVDYGYSGNNDPCSELGNACCEAGYDEAEMAALCAAYFGAAETRLLARMHLYSIMSDVAWSLWSVIQEHVSDLPVDFRAYGLNAGSGLRPS
jgi:thiamine kinase-like enzyme